MYPTDSDTATKSLSRSSLVTMSLLGCFGGRNGIPGPCPYPVVGNIGVLGKDHPGEYLQEWADKNGNPSVIRLDMGACLVAT